VESAHGRISIAHDNSEEMKTLLLAMFLLLPSAQALADEPVAPPADAPSTPRGRGWLGVEERNVWGLAANSPTSHPTSDYGADILAGIWLLNEHVQPLLDLGWSEAFGQLRDRTVNTFRGGGRVAIGSALAQDHLWVGGALGVVVQTGWLQVPPGSVTSNGAPLMSGLAWAASPSISGLLQGRFARRVLLGVEVGIEHSIPPLEWEDLSLFHSFRLQLGFEFGVILGNPVSGS
jgi:hypothetical protein